MKLTHYIKALNSLVEIKTSIAIFTSTIIATLYTYYESGEFRFDLFIAMLIAAVCLDAAATVFNHIYDYLKAKDKEGYLYTIHNPIVYYKLHPMLAILVGLGIIGLAGIMGLYLVYHTGLVLLWIGLVSAIIAVIYSYGKTPISYLPISEFISGFFEGTVVFMTVYYIQTGQFTIESFLVSIPVAIGISNIMLANNTTDIEEDIKNGRKTLAILLGRPNAIGLLITHTLLMFSLLVVYAALGMIPLFNLLTLLLIPLVIKNVHRFIKVNTKQFGFIKVLQNTILFNLVLIISYLIYFAELYW